MAPELLFLTGMRKLALKVQLWRLLVVLAVTASFFASAGQADEVPFATATTLGCFGGAACTPSSSFASTTDLSFQGASFGQPSGILSSGGVLDITLGSFTFNDSQTALLGDSFNALVTFTLPSVIAGSAQQSFKAQLYGIVVSNFGGLLLIDFNNFPAHFIFSNADYSGSFDFAVNDVAFLIGGSGASQSKAWTGRISNAYQESNSPTSSVPEPSSWALLGGGGVMLAGFVRRRALQ